MSSLLAVPARAGVILLAACSSASLPGPTAMRTYDPEWFTGWYRNWSETPGQPALWSLLATGLHAGKPQSSQLVQLRCAGRQLEVLMFQRDEAVAARLLRCEPVDGGVLAARWVDAQKADDGYRVAGWTSLKLWCRADRSLFVARETNGLALLTWFTWPFAQRREIAGPYATAERMRPDQRVRVSQMPSEHGAR